MNNCGQFSIIKYKFHIIYFPKKICLDMKNKNITNYKSSRINEVLYTVLFIPNLTFILKGVVVYGFLV